MEEMKKYSNQRKKMKRKRRKRRRNLVREIVSLWKSNKNKPREKFGVTANSWTGKASETHYLCSCAGKAEVKEEGRVSR